jgi:hypothetical protein
MNTKQLFQTLLLCTLIAFTSGVAQAQWGRKWDQITNSTAPRNEAPAAESLFSAGNPTTSEFSQGGFLDVLERQKTAIAGSWLLTINAGGLPLKALASFTADGIFLSSAQGDVNTNPGAPTITPIHGVWAHNGGRQFLTTHLELGYSVQTGELIGTLKLQQTINLNEAGDEWNSTFRFTLFDPNGKALFSGDGRVQAQRIKVGQ